MKSLAQFAVASASEWCFSELARGSMKIRIGYELLYGCPAPTPAILVLNVHFTRAADLLWPDYIITRPVVPLHAYRDPYGNWCTRLVLSAGETHISTLTMVNDGGLPDSVDPEAEQVPVEALPDETSSR